jgi:hypothetical protein
MWMRTHAKRPREILRFYFIPFYWNFRRNYIPKALASICIWKGKQYLCLPIIPIFFVFFLGQASPFPSSAWGRDQRAVPHTPSPGRFILLSHWLTEILDALPLVHTFLSCSPIGHFWSKGLFIFHIPQRGSYCSSIGSQSS